MTIVSLRKPSAMPDTARYGRVRLRGMASPILSKGVDPIETRRGLPGDADDLQSRYIEAAVGGMIIGCFVSTQRKSTARPEIRLQAGLV